LGILMLYSTKEKGGLKGRTFKEEGEKRKNPEFSSRLNSKRKVLTPAKPQSKRNVFHEGKVENNGVGGRYGFGRKVGNSGECGWRPDFEKRKKDALGSGKWSKGKRTITGPDDRARTEGKWLSWHKC